MGDNLDSRVVGGRVDLLVNRVRGNENGIHDGGIAFDDVIEWEVEFLRRHARISARRLVGRGDRIEATADVHRMHIRPTVTDYTVLRLTLGAGNGSRVASCRS